VHSPEIQKLIDSVCENYGSIEYYGSSQREEHGVGFKIPGIKATFSVLTLDGALKDSFDIQIEGVPSGDYVYTGEVSLQEFIDLVARFDGPEDEWP